MASAGLGMAGRAGSAASMVRGGVGSNAGGMSSATGAPAMVSGAPASSIPQSVVKAPTSSIPGMTTPGNANAAPTLTTSVAPDPSVAAQQATVASKEASLAANPTGQIPNYSNLVNSYNTLMGQSPLASQIQSLQGTLKTSNAGNQQAADEQAARQGITGSGAATQTKNTLDAATEAAEASGTTGLEQQDILNKENLLSTGANISNLGLSASNAANQFLLGATPTAEAGATTALGEGQLGLEQFTAQQNANQAQNSLALQAQQQQIAAEMALMQSAGSLFST
jgi:hypothetical protein